MRAAIEAAGAKLLYLPPYSPDFDPIENAFAKLKALLRKDAKRTRESLWTAIGAFIPAFTPGECAIDFAAAGYGAIGMENALNPSPRPRWAKPPRPIAAQLSFTRRLSDLLRNCRPISR